MVEKELGVIEDTLFVPLLGRIYASENFPSILYDKKALGLKSRLPQHITSNDTQTQYTYLASASRSADMDRRIADFLQRKPDGVIVELGVGLETTYYRMDNGHTHWYGVDLPHVIAYRRNLLPEPPRETYIGCDAFQTDWLNEVRKNYPDAPLLITASGFFYYFEESQILSLIRMLRGHGDIELLFDAVNKSGMIMMRRKYMKTIGHADAKMFFYVNSAKEFAAKVGGVSVIAEEPFYRDIDKTGLGFVTKISMWIADWCGMVKIVQLQIES